MLSGGHIAADFPSGREQKDWPAGPFPAGGLPYRCGLCLPKSRFFAALNFSPELQLSAAELMYYLAGYDCLREPVLDKEQRPTDKYEGSVFELSALARAAAEGGTVALITNDASTISPKLLDKLDRARLIVFSSGSMDCRDKEIRLLHISALRKGGEL